jgi:hypothetical protein
MQPQAHGGPPPRFELPEYSGPSINIWFDLISFRHLLYIIGRVSDPSGTIRDIVKPFQDFPKPLSESPSLFDQNTKLIFNRRKTLKCVTQWVQIYVDMPRTHFRGNDHMRALESLQ